MKTIYITTHMPKHDGDWNQTIYTFNKQEAFARAEYDRDHMTTKENATTDVWVGAWEVPDEYITYSAERSYLDWVDEQFDNPDPVESWDIPYEVAE